MLHLRSLAILLIFCAFSCQKDVSADIDFIGLWKETGSTKSASLEFKSDYTVIFNDTYNPVYTYFYKIDTKLKSINFSEIENPEMYSDFKYSFNSINKELTIWGLYISIPENPSVTIFRKY